MKFARPAMPLSPLAAVAALAAVLALGSTSALAHPTVGPQPAAEHKTGDSFELLLNSIDVVPPSREAFEEAFPGARDRLDAVARDTSRTTWSRIRAISMLSFFPEAKTAATLKLLSVPPAATLSADQKLRHPAMDPEIRRHALYTLGRAFGATADAALVRFIAQRVESDPDKAVQEHALRSLRWVDHDEAKVTLTRLSSQGPTALRQLATSTLSRRAARFDAPKFGH